MYANIYLFHIRFENKYASVGKCLFLKTMCVRDSNYLNYFNKVALDGYRHKDRKKNI